MTRRGGRGVSEMKRRIEEKREAGRDGATSAGVPIW